MLRYLFTLSYIFVSLSYASHAGIERLEKISLQLHWKYQFEFAGFIAAKEKGFYKDVGLDVTLKEYETGMNIENEVLTGKSEYGIYNSLSLLEYLRGKKLRLVSSYFKRAALVLVTSPQILSPEDLVGKRVMASTKEDFILNFKPYFDAYGVDIDNLTLVKHTYNIDAFADKKVDAMTSFVSNELHKLDERGIAYNVLDPSDENLYVLQLELITSQKEAQEHPWRVVAFREASIKGWLYALSHRDEIIDIIYNKYTKATSKKSLHTEAIGVQKLILPYTYNVGSIDKNFLDKQVKQFQKDYKVGSGKTLDDFIFNDKGYFGHKVFSKDELDYMHKHRDINVCINYGLFPIDGIKNGKMSGVMADIFQLISETTSIHFHPIESKSEADLQKKLRENKCQILSVVAIQNKTYKTLAHSHSFDSSNFALVSKLDKSFIDDVANLKGKLLLVQKESFKSYLHDLYPFLTIEVEHNKNKMISRVLNDEAYAIVTINEQADYLIDKYGYGKLKINAFLAESNPIKGSIGVQKSEAILLSIINKSLQQISKKKLDTIVNSWRITRYQKTASYAWVFKVLGVMSLILLIMIYYHKKLQHFNKELEISVNEKTKELREINDSLEETVSQKVQELIQKDEILTMQSKQAVMGEMISMIAHQWRQPLNTITLSISNIQIKQMMGNALSAEELNNSLDDISHTIVYLSETIDDFKTYFHPDKKKSIVKLDVLIERAINFVLPRIDSHAITLEHLKSSTIKIKAYENEFIQVLLNILHNAIDAYENIDMQKKKIIISSKLEEDKVFISIEDKAGGIRKENLKKIFEPYFSTKGKNGTGLGLYMSQMIIEKQFKGEIEIQTSTKGTKFIIKIPIALDI